MEFQSRWFGHEFHGVVDQLIDKKGLEHQILYKLDRPDGMCIFICIYYDTSAVQVIHFEIDCAIFYTHLHELFC